MKIYIILLFVIPFYFMSCNAISNESDMGSARVIIGENSRYIAGEGETIDQVIMGFMQEDVVYNFLQLEEVNGSIGEFSFTGLIVGNYSFLATLVDEEDNIVSSALQPVEIEAGLNEIIVNMGPGFEFKINGRSLELDDLDKDFDLSFSKDEITFGIPKEYMTENMMLEIETNAAGLSILDWNGEESEAYSSLDFTAAGDELLYEDAILYLNTTVTDRILMRLESYDGSIIDYKVKFKGR